MQADVSELLVRWSGGDERAALVREARPRMTGSRQLSWRSRRLFYALAPKTMRDILVDYWRRAVKRGGSQSELAFHDACVDFLILGSSSRATIEREWSFARSRPQRNLQPGLHQPAQPGAVQ